MVFQREGKARYPGRVPRVSNWLRAFAGRQLNTGDTTCWSLMAVTKPEEKGDDRNRRLHRHLQLRPVTITPVLISARPERRPRPSTPGWRRRDADRRTASPDRKSALHGTVAAQSRCSLVPPSWVIVSPVRRKSFRDALETPWNSFWHHDPVTASGWSYELCPLF